MDAVSKFYLNFKVYLIATGLAMAAINTMDIEAPADGSPTTPLGEFNAAADTPINAILARWNEPALWESSLPDTAIPTNNAALPLSALRVTSRAIKNPPTDDDMKEWSIIKDVKEWAGFKERDHELVTSFLNKCKVDEHDEIADFAHIDPGDFSNDLLNWKFDGEPAASGDKAKVRRFMHGCRVFAGLDDPLIVTLFRKENDKRKQQEIDWNKAQPKEKIIRTEIAASSNAPNDVPLHRRVKVMDIADDLSSQELELMSKGDIRELLKNWRAECNTKTDPPENQEPSAAQLSYLKMCKDNNETPYVNLGFWGPFGDRIFQRMLTVMWVCMADGSKMRQKFNGPYGVTQWLACWAVYACGMIMHKLASREAMDDYRFYRRLSRNLGC